MAERWNQTADDGRRGMGAGDAAADRRLSGQADCSVMGAEIREEGKSSAHGSTAAGITPASHNSRLPWRQKWLNAQ